MTRRTRHATRQALALLTRQHRPQDEDMDTILAAIPARDRHERRETRQQQQKEE